ncbi:ABC transporter substrate-binding protein [Peribacillus sp. SCS-26]|uniref:ABC transporter substrate-binding protein n=1 Tax=Paraperibacillus marinus TaxID=3115295 RepID=UPI0039058134
MKKRFMFMLAAAALIAVAAVYTATFFLPFNERDGEQEAVKMHSGKIELSFWRNYGNAAENKAYNKLIENFEKDHPNISVKKQYISYDDYELRLRTEFATGTPPDVMAIDSPNLGLYANNGSLMPIGSFMEKEGDIGDIPPATLKGLSYKGELYLAPMVESGVALYYNKHLFKAAGLSYPSSNPDHPLTWDEVLNIARKLTDTKKGVYGIDPAQGFAGGEAPAYFKMPLLWQFGGRVLSPDGSTASGYLDSEESLAALQFYQDLYKKYKVSKVELPPRAFETNKLAMCLLGSWALADLKNNPDFKLGKDFGVAPVPKAKYQAVPNGGWAIGISSKTQHPEEARKFLKYLTGYEGMKTYVELTGDIPARYSVARDFPEFEQYPKNIFVRQVQKYSANRPVTPAYPVVSEAIKILFEETGIEGRNVKDAAKEAAEKINRGINAVQEP